MTTQIESNQPKNTPHHEKEPDAIDQIVSNVLTEQRRKDAAKLAYDLSNNNDANNANINGM